METFASFATREKRKKGPLGQLKDGASIDRIYQHGTGRRPNRDSGLKRFDAASGLPRGGFAGAPIPAVAREMGMFALREFVGGIHVFEIGLPWP